MSDFPFTSEQVHRLRGLDLAAQYLLKDTDWNANIKQVLTNTQQLSPETRRFMVNYVDLLYLNGTGHDPLTVKFARYVTGKVWPEIKRAFRDVYPTDDRVLAVGNVPDSAYGALFQFSFFHLVWFSILTVSRVKREGGGNLRLQLALDEQVKLIAAFAKQVIWYGVDQYDQEKPLKPFVLGTGTDTKQIDDLKQQVSELGGKLRAAETEREDWKGQYTTAMEGVAARKQALGDSITLLNEELESVRKEMEQDRMDYSAALAENNAKHEGTLASVNASFADKAARQQGEFKETTKDLYVTLAQLQGNVAEKDAEIRSLDALLRRANQPPGTDPLLFPAEPTLGADASSRGGTAGPSPVRTGSGFTDMSAAPSGDATSSSSVFTNLFSKIPSERPTDAASADVASADVAPTSVSTATSTKPWVRELFRRSSPPPSDPVPSTEPVPQSSSVASANPSGSALPSPLTDLFNSTSSGPVDPASSSPLDATQVNRVPFENPPEGVLAPSSSSSNTSASLVATALQTSAVASQVAADASAVAQDEKTASAVGHGVLENAPVTRGTSVADDFDKMARGDPPVANDDDFDELKVVVNTGDAVAVNLDASAAKTRNLAAQLREQTEAALYAQQPTESLQSTINATENSMANTAALTAQMAAADQNVRDALGRAAPSAAAVLPPQPVASAVAVAALLPGQYQVPRGFMQLPPPAMPAALSMPSASTSARPVPSASTSTRPVSASTSARLVPSAGTKRVLTPRQTAQALVEGRHETWYEEDNGRCHGSKQDGDRCGKRVGMKGLLCYLHDGRDQ